MVRRVFTVVLLILAEIGAVGVALRVPSSPLQEIPHLPPDDAVLAAARLVAVGVGFWLTASTLLYILASIVRVPALVRGAHWITAPGIRRLLDGLLATTVVVSSAVAAPGVASAAADSPGPGLAAAANPAYMPHPAGDGPTMPSPSPDEPPPPQYTPRAAGDPRPGATPPPVTPAPSPAPPVDHVIYVLRPGDNLWSVAARQIADHRRRRPADLTARDIGRYWMRLIDANKTRLRSGDPNLVHPGETILLPSPATP